MQSLIWHLKYELFTKCQADKKGVEEFEQYKKHISKISGTLEYINENFRSNLSLTSVANKFFFSPAYLSRIFENTMGITFKKYIDGIRFAEAMSLLESTEKSIDDIAAESGFPNARAFVSMHKEEYGCLPSERRRRNMGVYDAVPKKNMKYIDFEMTHYLAKVAKYLDNEKVMPDVTNVDNVKLEYSFDASNTECELRGTFRNFCCVGRASDLLRENVRNMLRTAQAEIGFKYIKFHGILDDELSVCTLDEKGKPIFNFSNIDQIIDFLLSINLRPLVQLSFMPSALAKYPEKTVFHKPMIISEPKDYKVWTSLVTSLTRHFILRYGIDEVKTWLFSVWNELETPPDMFGFYEPDTAKKLYRTTYQAVKSVSSELKFGTTSVIYETVIYSDWFDEFIKSTADCRPDFVNFHFYPVNGFVKDFDVGKASEPMKLISDPYIFKKIIDKLKEKFASLGLSELPVYLTEWNSTTSHRDLLNDTAFKGAYVARNIIDNYDSLESFGYWSMTDDICELPQDKRLFHGGHGLFTSNGIKKPPYYAFLFLSKLGKNLLGKNKGIMATKDQRGFQMMLVNYIHYNDIYASGETFGVTELNRYNAFRSEQKKEFKVTFTNAENGTYIIEEYTVNRKHGSAFDVWADRFGANELYTKKACDELEKASQPYYTLSKIDVTDGVLSYITMTEPHEIKLVLINKI
jgi:xylan 1,4-beta-xylosidase